MSILTIKNRLQLLKNGKELNDEDLYPVVRVSTKDRALTWLLYKIDSKDRDLVYAFGGFKSVPPVLKAMKISSMDYGIHQYNRDKKFKPCHTIKVYIEAAKFITRLVEEPNILNIFAEDITPENNQRTGLKSTLDSLVK